MVSSKSCFCWLYRPSPSLAAKNIINLILVLTIWWYVKGQRKSPNKMVGEAKSHVETNPLPARDTQRAQTNPCVPQDPGTPQRISQTCLWVCECLLWRHGSAVACHRDRGSDCSRLERQGMWHKSSWRRWPLAPSLRHWADDPQTGEQLYQRSCCTVTKF